MVETIKKLKRTS